MVTREEGNAVFIALLRVQKLLLAARQTAPRAHPGVDVAAYPVLFVIAGNGTARVSDIAATLHNDVSTVSRQVSTFVTQGLVAKDVDPSDGRAHVVSLTDAGRDALKEIQDTRATWFQGLLQGWDSAETAEFVRHLRALGDALDSNLRAHGATPPHLPFDQTRKD